MKKISIITLILFVIVNTVNSQSNALDKKLEKAYKYCQREKYEDAEEYLLELLDENPQYGGGWDLLGKVRYQLYKDKKKTDNIFSNITVTTKDSTGKKDIQNDSLANVFMEMLSNIKPSKSAYEKYIFTLRKALLFSDDAYYSSMMLRAYEYDIEIDSNVSSKALKYFETAEDEFKEKNLEKALKYYKRAMDEQDNFYKAHLYYGDMFYLMGDMVNAIKVFKDIIAKYPDMLEPRKYLCDAYAKDRLYKNALDEAIKTMYVYPDLVMMTKLNDAVFLNHQKINIKWTARQVFPNTMNTDSTAEHAAYKNEIPAAQSPWDRYKAAFNLIKPYCNEKGKIVKINKLTEAKYMEVYCWEEMLRNSDDPSLEQAKKMQQDGYLDCYVLVSCFHFDILNQYKDFASKNQDRIVEYFNKYIVSQ